MTEQVKEKLTHIRQVTGEIIQEIQDQYLEDAIPWVIGFSGGKDSTAVLQLLFYAIEGIPVQLRTKEIHVISNDTLVENPSVINFLDSQLEKIRKAGKEELYAHAPDLFHVVKTTPKLEDTFWLNLIGKGYPSPNRWFRWCTERMKIHPTNEYIINTVSRHGKAIIVLGVRSDESATRAQSIKQHEIKGFRLRKHKLANAFVYAPITELLTSEVWAYLINTPNPWGANNQELLNLYRSAADIMECPLVIDDTTPSCGNSRFGCWVCTVVDQDKSMNHMIVNGEEWMEPLHKFRNWLKDIRDNSDYREKRSRNNQDRLGPFTEDTRKKILEEVLTLENQVNFDFLTLPELAAIQIQWHYDGKFKYSVADIYERIKGKKIMLPESPITQRRNEEFAILAQICDKHGIEVDHIRELMELERANISFLRRGTIFNEIKSKIERFVKEKGNQTTEAL